MTIAILLLLSLSIAVIYSSNSQLALQQLLVAILGLLLFLFIRLIDYRTLKVLIKPMYILALFFLVITLIIGIETRGSTRWISLGPFNFQPSEFAKPVLILAMANYWSKNTPSWGNILKSLVILLPFALLVFKQPDLGTAITLIFIWVGVLFMANLSFLKIFILSAFSIISLPLGWNLLQEYQKQRIISFFTPTQDPQGIGFHVIQSMIAVGSGGIFGRGLGRGTQSRLQFLPEFRTDFIFAFIAEELGFIGCAVVLFLYFFIFFHCFRLLSKIGDKFGELIIAGVLSMLFIQIAVNIGMNIGLLPITGITLPLLSYGGSSILVTLISLGFVSSIGKFGLRKREINQFELS